MQRIARAAVLAVGVTSAAPVLADDDDFAPECRTSADCGPLKCIEERCRDVEAILRGEEKSPHTVSIGHAAMFGDGRGYGAVVAVTDIVATLTEPFLVLATVSSRDSTASVLGVVSFVPASFGGSIVHAIHGRAIPAVISFFAWASLAGTTFVVGGLFGLAADGGNGFNSLAAWTAGLSFGALGAAGLTYLDVFMARDVPTIAPKRSFASTLAPSVMPIRGGAIASLGATW